MAKEICISSTPHETRLAILEDDQLTEIYYERENEYTLAGSIYKGRVTRVLPGMQSAFVDVGLERDAFLYVTDFLEEQEDSADFERVDPAGQRGEKGQSRSAQSKNDSSKADKNDPSRNDSSKPDRSKPEVLDAQPSASSEATDDQDEETRQDGRGTRRWRGRRRGLRGRSRNEEQGGVKNEAPQLESADEQNRQELTIQPQSQAAEVAKLAPQDAPADAGSVDAGTVDIDASIPWDDTPARSSRKHERGRSRRSGRDSRSGRHGRPEAESLSTHQESLAPESFVQEPAGEPFLLPGESLARYGGGSVESATGKSEASATSAITAKPSTLVEATVSGWDGGFVLPGESLSRRGREPKPAAQTRSEAVAAPVAPSTEPESLAAELSSATALPLMAPVALIAEALVEPSVTEAQIATEPAQGEIVFGHFDDAPTPESVSSLEAASKKDEEPSHEFEPSEAAASYRVDPSAPSEFRMGSTAPEAEEPLAEATPANFTDEPAALAATAHSPEAARREASTEDQPAAAEVESAVPEVAKPEVAKPEAATLEVAGPEVEELEITEEDEFELRLESESQAVVLSAPEAVGGDIYGLSAGIGIFEEEELEEEEFDLGLISESIFEDHESDELEEEILDQGDYLGEFVRDTHIEERLSHPTEQDEESEIEDDEELAFADSDEEDADEEESADAQPSAQPARREGRKFDRRRGRQGNGRQRQSGGGGGGNRRPSVQTMDLPIISELLKQGQEILVQIAKEPIAKKGARITSHIALPGRFLVFMPTVNHVGVSRKISSDEERQRLKRILIHEKGTAAGGFIVRTAADGASEEELRADLRFLIHLWAEIKERADAGKAPSLIYHDLNLIERILRDQVSEEFSTIWVDSETDYERIVRLLSRFKPSLVRRVKLYTKETPLFEQFGIQEEITRALRSKVWLKSGGSIVINQTEALVAIDINTGKYVGKTARLEDTIVKTNLDAISEIVRQIRLRDLGGIIVIDFIDMDERKNRHKVLQALEEELKHDRAPSKVLQFNDFGLVAITRKRVKQSLERTLSVPCTICTGTGMVKSPTTVANEIYIEMRKMQRHLERSDVLLRVHPEVVKTLKANSGRWLNDLEEITNKTIIVKSDPALHPEQFDIQ